MWSKIFIRDLLGTNETIQEDSNLIEDEEEAKVQKPPFIYRSKEFFESHFTQLLISALVGLAVWNVELQIVQAVQQDRLQRIDDDLKEIKVITEDKYIRKDVYDIQIETLKDKIEKIEDELKKLKNAK